MSDAIVNNRDLSEDPLAEDPLADEPFADDPFADDLGARLEALAPRRMSRTTLALGGAVLVVAGFLGGVLVQKGVTPATANPASGAGFGANGGGFGQAPGAGAGAGAGTQRGVTTGTVKLVDGTTVYVTTADGETVVVKTSATTTVTQARPSSVRELAPGTAVTVTGSADGEGIVTATQVTAQTSTK